MGFFDSGIAEGLNQTTGQMLHTGMQIYQHKAQQAIQQERLRIDQEQLNIAKNTAEQSTRLHKIQADALERENELIDVDDSLDKLGFRYQEEKEFFYKKALPYIDNIGGARYLSRGNGKKVIGEVSKSPEDNLELGDIRIRNINKDIEGIQTQLSNPDGKIKPEQAQELITKKETLITERTQIARAIKKEQDKVLYNTDDLKEYKYYKETDGGKLPFNDWMLQKKKASATRVSTDIKVGDTGMSKIAETMGKQVVEDRATAELAASSLDNIKEAEKLLNNGVITGTGADYITNVGNFLTSRLGFSASKDPVANTQAYAAMMGKEVGKIIKDFGSGTGLSDADREYAEKIAGGRITMTEEALRRLLKINKKSNIIKLKKYNEKADKIMKKPGADALPFDLHVSYNEEDGTTADPLNIRNR